MKNLIEEIVKVLVDHPEEVQVQEVAGEQSIVYEIKVEPGDIGKVIGKQGKTANAIRALIRAAAAKNGKNAVINIIS
jgi:predicted RNA-binding protein YlqC (UPF0109 family)